MATDRIAFAANRHRSSPLWRRSPHLSHIRGCTLANRHRWPFWRCFSTRHCCFFPDLCAIGLSPTIEALSSPSYAQSGCEQLQLLSSHSQSDGEVPDFRERGSPLVERQFEDCLVDCDFKWRFLGNFPAISSSHSIYTHTTTVPLRLEISLESIVAAADFYTHPSRSLPSTGLSYLMQRTMLFFLMA